MLELLMTRDGVKTHIDQGEGNLPRFDGIPLQIGKIGMGTSRNRCEVFVSRSDLFHVRLIHELA